MQQLGRRHKRVRDEIQELTNIYATHCQLGSVEAFERGIELLDARWEKLRRGSKAKWTEATLVGWKAGLLARLGRVDEALALELHGLTLHKTNDETILTLVNCGNLLQRLGRAEEAYGYALQALSICQPPRDLHWVIRVLQSVVTLERDSFLADTAARYGELVMAASRLPLMARLIEPGRASSPLEVLYAFQHGCAMASREAQGDEELRRAAGAGN